jgi:hypothetical protein
VLFDEMNSVFVKKPEGKMLLYLVVATAKLIVSTKETKKKPGPNKLSRYP